MKNILLALLLLLPTAAFAQDTVSPEIDPVLRLHPECRTWSEFAGAAMTGRQMGQSRERWLALADDQELPQQDRRVTQSIVGDAFDFPIEGTHEGRVAVTEAFRARVLELCLKSRTPL